ncbi:MAG: STAS domain-containing protein [Eubacteriales bacterium]
MSSLCKTYPMGDRSLAISIEGELDHHRAREISRYIDQQIDCNLPLSLTLNLAEMSFSDSSGIAVLLRAKRRMGQLDGTLVIEGAQPQPSKVFDAAGLQHILQFQ